jgi:hypothetical protein
VDIDQDARCLASSGRIMSVQILQSEGETN